ncbi:MAG: hypothetical protein V4628_15475 [Pseudomonadota bacterium]
MLVLMYKKKRLISQAFGLLSFLSEIRAIQIEPLNVASSRCLDVVMEFRTVDPF